MLKSSKNLLQEYCQKNKHNPPVYSQAVRLDKGLDNTPTWKTTVKLFNNKTFEGVAGTIKDAELIAAKRAYEFVTENLVQPVVTYSVGLKVGSLTDINFGAFAQILLVDGDNCDLDIQRVGDDVLILIFVSKNTTKKIVFQFQAKYDNCFVFVSDSVGKDAADHLLTFYAGKLSLLASDALYYVLTKDHYGEFLEKFMNKCKFICSLDEMT